MNAEFEGETCGGKNVTVHVLLFRLSRTLNTTRKFANTTALLLLFSMSPPVVAVIRICARRKNQFTMSDFLDIPDAEENVSNEYEEPPQQEVSEEAPPVFSMPEPEAADALRLPRIIWVSIMQSKIFV